VDLIVPIWFSARSGHREEFGNMTKPQEACPFYQADR
jgi:hypothetical protein